MNLEVRKDSKAFVGFHTTSKYSAARVRLADGGRVLFEETTDVAPDKPFTREIALPAGVAASNLKAILSTNKGSGNRGIPARLVGHH